MTKRAGKDGWSHNINAVVVLVLMWTELSDNRMNGKLPDKDWKDICKAVQDAYQGDITLCTEERMRKHINELLRGGCSKNWETEAKRQNEMAFAKFEILRGGYKQKGPKKASEYFSSEPERLNSPCGSQDFGPNHQKTFASEALIAADYSIVSAAAYPPEGNSRKRKSNEHTSGRSAKSGNRIISETELAKRDYLSGYGNQHHAVFPEPASNEITRPSRPHVNDGPTDKANEDLYSKGNLSHYSGSLSLFHDTKITDFLRESASNSLVLTSNQQKFATPATPIQIAKKQSSGSMHRSSQSPFEAVGLTTRDFPNGNASYDPGYPRTKHWELKITGLMEELTRVKEENKLLRAAIHHRDLYSQPIQTGPNFFTPSYQSMETIGDAALATDTQLPMGNQVWGAQSTEWDVTGGEGGLNWDVTDHAGYSEDAFYGEPPRTLAERYRLDF